MHNLRPAYQIQSSRLNKTRFAQPQSLNLPALIPFSKRLLQLVVLCVAAMTMLGAGDPSTRFDKLGHKLMCPCGCAEILLECNHVGCPDSAGMIAELHSGIATGMPSGGILNWFAAKYGPTVLAAPIRGGFDIVAWVVPFAVLALGLGGVILLLRLWRERHAQTALPASPLASSDGLRDRIRRETTFEP